MITVISRSFLNAGNKVFQRGLVRNASLFRKLLAPFARRTPEPRPPYGHVCQVGDPLLRIPAEPVDLEVIPTVEFQKFIKHLVSVMRKYEAFGLSAPQIGVSSQIIVLEMTEKALKGCKSQKDSGQPMEVIPLKVFINPKMKILDYTTSKYEETCISICGYAAEVSRAKKVQIEALDVSGQPFIWEARDWGAKLIQHEMDHLKGTMFTDKMDPKTFSCVVWNRVNRSRGNIGLHFYPTTKSLLKTIMI